MKKALVAYFSASGTTAKLAKRIADAAKADMFEIRLAVPYSAADLDWTNPKSRSGVEMKDKTYRPAIADSLDASDYDVVFVGFPIWWYVAPTIVNTFLESIDLKGKKVVPFATSGGSGMGNTSRELAVSCSGAEVVAGRRFSTSVSDGDLEKWVISQL